MIRRCNDEDFNPIWTIVNDGSRAYKGVIPVDCWTEPYMSQSELRHEIDDGVSFWGYEVAGELAGVMGIQAVQDVTLIRHAYVRTSHQQQGIGSRLLSHMLEMTPGPILIGTWQDAAWAIRFYEKHGFQIVPPPRKTLLLTRYWKISQRQEETSVVLADRKWLDQERRKSLMNTRAQTDRESLDFTRFQAITFDCYGTLIDWESGLLGAMRPILRAHGKDLTDAEILALYSELEPKEQNPYQRYRDVLAKVVRRFGDRLGFFASEEEAQSLPASLKNWKPFPDTNAALAKLSAKYKLAIISNTDDDLFAATSQHFETSFAAVVTAEQAKAYKPSLAPFRLALERLGFPPEQVLHVGQSVYHDVLPAQLLGMSSVLVYRRGFGATVPTEGDPDLKVPDMQTLARLAFQPAT